MESELKRIKVADQNHHPKTTVAVVGATGQLGSRVVKSLLEQGHVVVACIRARGAGNTKAAYRLETLGATICEIGNYDENRMISAFKGNDVKTVIVSIRATGTSLVDDETRIIHAAKASGTVTRFCPDEWGTNTLALQGGECPLFDAKRKMQALVKDVGLNYTLVFTSGFAHYHLPTLKWGPVINTFGDLAAKLGVLHMDDVGWLVAKACTDTRTLNHAVMFDWNLVSQAEALIIFSQAWPKVYFKTSHTPSGEILRLRDAAILDDPSKISAAGGHEPDADRWGINYVNLVLGRMVVLDSNTKSGRALYPDVTVKTVSDMLHDKAFCFNEDSNEFKNN